MGTLRDVWKRLKALLEAGSRGSGKAGASDDNAKKVAAAGQQFTSAFLRVFSQIEKQYKAKADIEADLKKSTTEAMKLVQTLQQKVKGQPDDDLDGRMEEMFDRMKELNKYGFQVQWD